MGGSKFATRTREASTLHFIRGSTLPCGMQGPRCLLNPYFMRDSSGTGGDREVNIQFIRDGSTLHFIIHININIAININTIITIPIKILININTNITINIKISEVEIHINIK